MAGNVWEWTTDWWSATPADAESCCAADSYDPAQPQFQIGRKVIKGGSFLCADSYCLRYRPAARRPQMVDTGMSHIGFRCVRRRETRTTLVNRTGLGNDACNTLLVRRGSYMTDAVLVTGAFGLVGSSTVKRLAADGRRVVATDLDIPANRKAADKLPSGVEVQYADLTDPAAVDALIAGVAPAAIIHLAAIIPPFIYMRKDLAEKVNVGATRLTAGRRRRSSPTRRGSCRRPASRSTARATRTRTPTC